MSAALVGERLIEAASSAAFALDGCSYAISADAARCLWMLDALPGRSIDLWKKVCSPWPAVIHVVGGPGRALPPTIGRDDSVIVREFEAAMVRDALPILLPGTSTELRLVTPPFVLAEILLEEDRLKATRLAGLLRCLEMGGRDVDLEDVRVLLKAVRAGDRFGLLAEVASVI